MMCSCKCGCGRMGNNTAGMCYECSYGCDRIHYLNKEEIKCYCCNEREPSMLMFYKEYICYNCYYSSYQDGICAHNKYPKVNPISGLRA